mgnify:CR=1 FL=1
MFHVKHISIGQIGEDAGKFYLEKKGFNIIVRNYKKKYGEIDIIAQLDKTIHYVEVKTLVIKMDNVSRETLSIKGLLPEDNLTKSKLAKFKKIVQMFHVKHFTTDYECELDLLSIYLFYKNNFNKDFINKIIDNSLNFNSIVENHDFIIGIKFITKIS